jgi:acyl-coenzyme A synthetase/AMP-(fatty) acid ligase
MRRCEIANTGFQFLLRAADQKTMTYSEVLGEVSRVANWLKSQGVAAGDSVAIYLPMILQLPITMLACARIGAVHSVVFGGFSSEALADRLVNCTPQVLVTASGVMRGAKKVELKKIADEACSICKSRGHEVLAFLHVLLSLSLPVISAWQGVVCMFLDTSAMLERRYATGTRVL